MSIRTVFQQEHLPWLYQRSILLIKRADQTRASFVSFLEAEGFNRLATATNEERGWRTFIRSKPDLCLIDLNLSGKAGGGISLSEKIRSYDPLVPIVFFAPKLSEKAYLKSRHVWPTAYVDDTYLGAKLKQVVELALLNGGKKDPFSYSLQQGHVQQLRSQPPTSVFIKIGEYYKNIQYRDILYFYASDKLTFAYVNGRSYPTNMLLKDLEAELFPEFQRIHRKYLVNTKHIEHINLKDEQVGLHGQVLPIGYAYKKDFLGQVNLVT